MRLYRLADVDVHFRVHNGLYECFVGGRARTRLVLQRSGGFLVGWLAARARETRILTGPNGISGGAEVYQRLFGRAGSVPDWQGESSRLYNCSQIAWYIVNQNYERAHAQTTTSYNDAKATTACQANFSHSCNRRETGCLTGY